MHKESSTRIVYFALIASRSIIAFGVWWVFFKNNPADIPKPSSGTGDIVQEIDSASMRYYIDQDVILQGDISSKDGIGLYSHDFTNNSGQSFGLKSADIDLDTYKGSVSIKGKVTEIEDNLPIVKVTEIVSEALDEVVIKLEADNKFTYIPDAGLVIDLTIADGFSLEETSEDIKILDTTADQPEVVLSITPFDCTSGDALKDCEKLQENFKKMNAESFVSSNGITYSNLTETNTRLAFDGQGKGLYLRPSGEKNLTSFVDLISFVNNTTLKDDITSIAKKTCGTLEDSLASDYAIESTTQSDGLLKVTLRGTSVQTPSTKLTCIYQAKIGSNIEFQHISTSTQEDPNAKKIEEIEEAEEIIEDKKELIEDDKEVIDKVEEEVAEDEETESGTGDIQAEEEDDGNTAEIVEEGEYEGWLSFGSSRGYTLYFADKGVGYAGSYLDDTEKLQIGGISCGYGVKVTKRTNIDNVQDSPDSIIYECGGDIQLADIPEGASYVNKYGDKHFIKKDLTETYVGMEVGIGK